MKPEIAVKALPTLEGVSLMIGGIIGPGLLTWNRI
jgi:hypothetical protein